MDATEPIRLMAGQFVGAEQGTSCTQSSFKANGKAFLYIGQQGGRHKAMFKLRQSVNQASEMAGKNPDDVQVGKLGKSGATWVTIRFTDQRPVPKKLWQAWLRESHDLATGSTGPKQTLVKTFATAGNKSAIRKKK